MYTKGIPFYTGTDLLYSTKRVNGYQKLHQVYMSNFDAVVVIIQIIFFSHHVHLQYTVSHDVNQISRKHAISKFNF
jgi:hypothetical protein